MFIQLTFRLDDVSEDILPLPPHTPLIQGVTLKVEYCEGTGEEGEPV